MKFIEDKGMNHVDIYKKAHISRKLLSKIKKDPFYVPSKRTAVAFAIALRLTFEETQALLSRAGFTLSDSILFDVIIKYFITNEIYDIFQINEVLFYYKQQILGE